MFTLLFLICMLGIFGKLLVFAGLIYLAFPILIIVGIVTLLSRN